MAKVYKPLSSLGKIVTGKTPSTSDKELWGEDFPFITPTDIKGYDTYYQTTTERKLSLKGAKKQLSTLIPPNSICVTCIGSTIGKSCITKSKSITNQQINTIIPNDENDFRYVYYLIRESLPYFELIGGGSGSGTPIISKNKFAKFKFPVEENIKIQQKIASILSAYDNLIENNNKRIKLLEQMAENLYKEWFVRFRYPGYEDDEFMEGLPKRWELKRIGDICQTIGGGTPSTSCEEYWNGDIKWVTPTDITSKDSLPLLKIEGRITEEGLKHSSAKLVPPYTILMTSRASIGYFGISDSSVCTNQGFISIIPNQEFLRMYLLYNLKSRKDEIVLNANGSTFLEISKSRFRKMKIVIPPTSLLEAFENKTNAIFNIVKELEKQSLLLAQQRNRLLPRLMSGKLEIKLS